MVLPHLARGLCALSRLGSVPRTLDCGAQNAVRMTIWRIWRETLDPKPAETPGSLNDPWLCDSRFRVLARLTSAADLLISPVSPRAGATEAWIS
jgi:hypothetical protein